MMQRYGGSVVPLLFGDRKPSLAEIGNTSAHGDPFDGFPVVGLARTGPGSDPLRLSCLALSNPVGC